MTEEQRKQLEELTLPLIKFLAENCHPHTKLIIENNSAELVEGVVAFTTDEFLKD